MKNKYAYGALNRLEYAKNVEGEEAEYFYNGLGHRVGRLEKRAEKQDAISEIKTEYIIDLTKQYYNLLQKEEAGNRQRFLWDQNVAGMTEGNSGYSFYLQDELGSPMRLADAGGGLQESYSYDEFGQDLYPDWERLQPFGYTGYQADRTAGTYFAQAREYMPSAGGVVSRDADKFIRMRNMQSINLYQYCMSSPLRYIDPSGNDLEDQYPLTRNSIYDAVQINDLRGNMTGVTVNGKQIKQFIFDAANRMSFSAEATDDFIKKAEYRYNGLGQRIGQNIRRAEKESTDIAGALINIPMSEMPEEKVNYTLDPTRTYYNMLCLETGNKWQNFYWDGNVVSMEEEGTENYYIHDDLGSPARLLDERGGSREVYGYDEFGVDLCRKSGQPYQQIQPFGFTGYQMDEVGGVYFAQARRYDAGVGRFISEDFIRGFTTAPYTLNRYGYCWNRPLDLVDLDGQIPTWVKYAGTAVIVAAITVGAAIIAPVAAPVVAITTVVGAIIGGVTGGITNVITGSGSLENGASGGAINGAISVGGSFLTSPYISNGIGGTVGSLITDALNNYDRPKEEWKSFSEMYYSARIAGGTQFILGGSLASLWACHTGDWNIANTTGINRVATGLWETLFANGFSFASGAQASITAGEIWKRCQERYEISDENFAKE